MKKPGVHFQTPVFLATKNRVFDGLGCPIVAASYMPQPLSPLKLFPQAVTEKMMSMSTVPEHIFEIIMDTFRDDLKNKARKETKLRKNHLAP